jgi:integrase
MMRQKVYPSDLDAQAGATSRRSPDETGGGEEQEQKERRSLADRVLELLERLELAHDASGEGYAMPIVDGVRQVLAIRSKPFRDYVRLQCFVAFQKSLNGEVLAQVVETIAARAALHAMWAWAIRQGRAETNPVAGTEPPATTPVRDRVLSLEELGAIWRATGEPRPFHRIVRLLLLLGARRGEVAGMCGRELADLEDPGRAAWTVPSARSKSKRSRVLPLPDAARRIVREALADLGGDRDRPLFGMGRDGFSGFGAAKKALDRRLAELRARLGGFAPEALAPAELDRFALAPWRLHDLRRSCATHLAERSLASTEAIAHLLGHADPTAPRVTATVYVHAQYRDHLRRALDDWAALVLEAAGEARPEAKPVAFAGARR